MFIPSPVTPDVEAGAQDGVRARRAPRESPGERVRKVDPKSREQVLPAPGHPAG